MSRTRATGPGEVSHTQASQSILPIDVHGAATADAFSTATSEGDGGIELILDSDQGIQDHRAGLVQVEGVGLKARLLAGCIGVPSVNLEGPQLGLGLCGSLTDGGHGAGEDSSSSGARAEGCPHGGGAEEARGSEGGHDGNRNWHRRRQAVSLQGKIIRVAADQLTEVKPFKSPPWSLSMS